MELDRIKFLAGVQLDEAVKQVELTTFPNKDYK